MNGTKSFRIDRRGLLRAGLGLLLLSPYLIWGLEISVWHVPTLASWWPPLRYAMIQSFLSAGLSCALGFLLWHGLQTWQAGRGTVEIALLLPNMLPPLFLALALFSVVVPVIVFPYGLGAVIFAHVVLNCGLAAVALDRLISGKLGAMAETAWILGASRRAFWLKIAWPQIRGDLASLFLFIFSLCFTSFSLPLLLSGGRDVTLEVAIYDAIRSEGAWDKAVQLAALQAGVLLGLAYLLPTSFWPDRPARTTLGFLGWRPVRYLVFLPAAILISGWGLGLTNGLRSGLQPEVWQALPMACFTSLILALATGGVHLLLFLLTAFVLPHRGLTRFLNGYLAPSGAITGFALLMLPFGGEVAGLGKLVLALSLISFPLLYRWIVHSALTTLEAQILVARTLGAGWGQILFEIVWPQAAPAFLKASGLAAVWAVGDFALSGILLGAGARTLPLLIQDQLGNYRFEEAALLLIPLILLSAVSYSVFVKSESYVVG